MKFLRTASTRRLLATIAGLVIAVAAGTAIAVAATGSGPVPKAKPLAQALHAAATAQPVDGISAHIQFTNGLISSTDFTGQSVDPILQGASGRFWAAKGEGLRLELQTTNGDTQVIVRQNSFWVSDPATQTVYEGTLPAGSNAPSTTSGSDKVPTVAQIQTELTKLLAHVDIGGTRTSDPTDVAGQPAYRVSVSPKHSGGLLGSAQLAWDAVTGTPLDVAVYARGDGSPVLELKATSISFGHVAASVFDLTPPSGYHVVKIATPTAPAASKRAEAKKAKHATVTGVSAVAAHLPFTLAAPASLVGLPRQGVRLLDWGGKPAALVTYGQGLGGLAIIEQTAAGSAANSSSGSSNGSLSLPSVSINGATGTQLATALGTVLHFSLHGVGYTVLGSVPPSVAQLAATKLTASP